MTVIDKINTLYSTTTNNLSYLTNISPIVLYDYQKGKDISKPFKLLLELLLNPETFYTVFNKNKNKIGKVCSKRIEKAVQERLLNLKIKEFNLKQSII